MNDMEARLCEVQTAFREMLSRYRNCDERHSEPALWDRWCKAAGYEYGVEDVKREPEAFVPPRMEFHAPLREETPPKVKHEIPRYFMVAGK